MKRRRGEIGTRQRKRRRAWTQRVKQSRGAHAFPAAALCAPFTLERDFYRPPSACLLITASPMPSNAALHINCSQPVQIDTSLDNSTTNDEQAMVVHSISHTISCTLTEQELLVQAKLVQGGAFWRLENTLEIGKRRSRCSIRPTRARSFRPEGEGGRRPYVSFDLTSMVHSRGHTSTA